MELYDTHIHSHHSHDGKFSCKAMADEAIKRGLNGICITDHFDSGIYHVSDDFEHIRKSVAEARFIADNYKDKIEITAGVELGDYPFGKEIAMHCLDTVNFDYVLCSMHATVIGKKIFESFSGIKSFSSLSEDENKRFLKMYFEYTLKTVRSKDFNFDSLAHLTYPLRYIVAINKNKIDIKMYYPVIKEILGTLIERDKSLEINTSCLATEWKHTLPDYEIIKMYYASGGRKVTLGSDSHFTERLGLGFTETMKMLKEIGFTDYYRYKNRKPVAISLH